MRKRPKTNARARRTARATAGTARGPVRATRKARANAKANRKARTNANSNANRKAPANANANKRRLLPVMRPAQNMRDIIKQMVLLEDHLFQPQKRCVDCIRKHFLTVEALAEECATLCKPEAILPECRAVATGTRVLHHAWEQRRKDPRVAEGIAGRLRRLRKGLMKRFSALPLEKLPSRETEAVRRLVGGAR